MSANGRSRPDPRLDLEALEAAINRRLTDWENAGVGRRVWERDGSLWPGAGPGSAAGRLGWLELPETMAEKVDDLTEFADEVREDGYRRIVVLGMGGSSLAPEVYARTYGPLRGHPELRVLDSTHPSAVRTVLDSAPIEHTFFLVSSKSGTTLEPNSLFRFFWRKAGDASGDPGRQFAAITDPETPLERLAEDRGFRQCFHSPIDVGGRYSALTEFGLVPAALAGVPIRRLLEHARRMAKACSAETSAIDSPGLRLGAELGESARAGRNKVVFVTSPLLRAFPSWIEQLIAESTGKNGVGIVPVVGEPSPLDAKGARDELLVYLTMKGEEDEEVDAALARSEAAGTPALVRAFEGLEDLGREFFRWEFGVATAGIVLGIDPFDQPDVELAKQLAREALERVGAPAPSTPEERVSAEPGPPLRTALSRWGATALPDGYVAIQAFLAPTPEIDGALAELRTAVRDRLKLSTTLGYGPRFLHSTGQLHKGGPPNGLFLQIVDRTADDLPIPETDVTFGRILRAQAAGDSAALRQRQRHLLTIDVGDDVLSGLRSIAGALRE